MGNQHVLAIDQGTTSTRAILFDQHGASRALARREVTQHYPAPGWVEHDPEDIWRGVCESVREVLARAVLPQTEVAALGITNQRETTVIWERASGRAIHNAIVWQDRRTADACARLKAAGAEDAVRRKTGLVLDPYFSATKIAWLLDELPGARARAEAGQLAFGTIDSFLVWRLTGGAVHATDVTNASRTLLFDLNDLAWSDELLDLFGVPRALLPNVVASSGPIGTTRGVPG